MASSVILQLSDFLRHQIYGKNDENVLLTGEVEFLTNLLNLEKIRRDHFEISIAINKEDVKVDINNLYVPANLFTTLVENAVKHSVDPYGTGSFIRLHFSIDNKQLTFVCRNYKTTSLEDLNENDSGLGLINTQRRLKLCIKINIR